MNITDELQPIFKECYRECRRVFTLDLPDYDQINVTWKTKIHSTVGWAQDLGGGEYEMRISWPYFYAVAELCGLVIMRQRLKSVIMHEFAHIISRNKGGKMAHDNMFYAILSRISPDVSRYVKYDLDPSTNKYYVQGTQVAAEKVHERAKQLSH